MENENENFDQLKKLLALKKHELPPPGYFNKLPGEITSRIRAERTDKYRDPMSKLNAEAPWLMRLWQTLEGKPIFAGAFGAAICALALTAIFMAEKPPTQPTFAGPRNIGGTPLAGAPAATVPANATGVGGTPLYVATNQTGPTLFDLLPYGQPGGQSLTVPASVNP